MGQLTTFNPDGFSTTTTIPGISRSAVLPSVASRQTNSLFGSDAGDSIGTARNLGSLRRGSTFRRSGEVGERDLDFFKFRVDRKTNFTARLTNEDADPDSIAITILNRSGKPVNLDSKILFRNVEPGDTGTISVSNLPKGEYYVRLQSEQGNNQDYTLELSRSRSNGGSDAAREIGSLVANRSYDYSGTVGGSDIDFYRFSVDDRSRFTARLLNESNDPIALSLLNTNKQVVQTDNGRFLFGNAEPGRSIDLFAPTLPRGTYFIRVQSEVGLQESYDLSLRRSPLSVTPL